MKNKILLLAAILFITLNVDARVPRVKNKSFSYETVKLPEMALPENRTYTLFLETAADYGNLALRYQSVMRIPGWLKANKGEYEVDVKLFPVDYLHPKLISRKEVIKDSTGNVIKTKWFYKNVYKAIANGSLNIFDKDKHAIYSSVLNQVSMQRSGKEFRTKKAARRHSAREGQRFQQQMAQAFVKSFSAQVNNRLDRMLGIYPIRKSASLMIVRNKKHSEFEPMNAFWTRFQNIADHVNMNSDLAEVESKLFNEIAYLKNIQNNYRGSSKADRKIRYIAFRNLSEIYEMLEMPQEAIVYAQKIRSNDFRKFRSNTLIADAQRMKRLQDIHGS